MQAVRSRLFFALLLLSCVSGGAQELPLDLAFDRAGFLWGAGPALSPDGQWVAYSVRRTPRLRGLDLDARYQPNGVPSSVLGSRLFLQQIGGAARDICPNGANCWRPSWSPDSSVLAFYSDAGGFAQLWLFEPETDSARLVSEARVKAKLWAGDEARWSPDAKRLYVPLFAGASASSVVEAPDRDAAEGARVTVLGNGSEAGRASGLEDRPLVSFMLAENNASLGAIEREGGDVEIVVPAGTEPRPSVLRISASGRWMSYLSVFRPGAATSQASTYALAVVPTDGGPVTVIAEELPVGNDYHRQNYSWHPTDDRLVFLKDDGLWLVDLQGSTPSKPQRLAAGLGKLTPIPLWFTRDGSAVVVGCEEVDLRDYYGPRPGALARVPLDGGAPQVRSLGSEWQFQRLVRARPNTLWQRDSQHAHVVLRHLSTGESSVARLAFSNDREEAPDILWRGIARVRGFAASADHSKLVGLFESVDTPPDVVAFGAGFARERVSAIDPLLEEVARPTAEILEVDIPLADGSLDKVRTAVLLPPGAKRGDRLPGIVMTYPGGDATKSVENYGGGSTTSLPTQIFLSRGYAVVLANLKLGTNRQAGNPLQEMTDALLPQVYRAAELGYVDLRRLGLAGQSFGGFGTAGIVSRTNLFRAAVAISGIYDLGGTYGHLGDDYTSFWIGWSEGGQARMGTHPWADVRRYVDNSPYYQADKIRTPLLLLHGDKDQAVHDAEKLFTALRRLERDVQLALYKGQGHVVLEWNRAEAIDAAERMLEFFGRHLSGE
ncbi:MAG: prolyl oligopeptidase family serine peptidase [Acidobacteriota bacterium]